jgi:general secretion pathway protein D
MKRQIIFLTVVLALLYLAGCITANSAKIGDLSDDSAETGQNLPTEETMDQELPDEKLPENVPDSPGTQEETPVLAENAQEINNISPKQVQKWAFIGKISKEHSTLLNVLMLHTKDTGKSYAIINKNSSKYSEKYFRFLPYGTSVYISKDNELFINKKGGSVPEEVAAVNKKQNNNTETSPPEYKPADKQIITAPADEADEGQKIALNFDNADIYEVINSLSDILGINFIIDPAVKGKVNIHTSTEISRDKLLPVLESIFDINNIALVKSGDLYKIIPVKSAKSKISAISEGRQVDLSSSDRIIVQVIPLKYVSTTEVINILKPFISSGGNILEYKKGNIIIAADRAASIKKIVAMINVVDIDTFEHTRIHFFKIENAEVEELAQELESVFTALGIAKTTEKGIGISFIPIERVSCILAVSSIPGIFKKVEHWTKILDTIDTEAEEQVFVYFVENGKAEEITDVLDKIYGDGNKKSRSSTSKRSSKSRTKTTKGKKAAQTSFIQGEIKIVDDEATNSIIVRSTPHDYAIIKKTIRTMDIIPKQVLIEVLIAEVTLGDGTQYGVEWALRSDRSWGGYDGEEQIGLYNNRIRGLGDGVPDDDNEIPVTDFLDSATGGLAYVFDSDRLRIFLHAQADTNKLNILSAPSIMAADNQEARIEVGEEVPIVTSEYVPLDTGSNVGISGTSTSRSIEYRNTGVILTVTPRINDKGLVAMEISQEVSKAQAVAAGGIQSPVISNRKVETTLVVQSGQTVVIGGLIEEVESYVISGIPYLSRLPWIGFLFGTTSISKAKKELILLITPHVIETINEADSVTREIREKMNDINELIKTEGSTWSTWDSN